MANRNILDHLDWEKEQPKLYSKELIMTFTLFFSVLLGAILYIHNLRAIGKWRKGVWITLGAVAYYCLTISIPDFFPIPFFTQIFFNIIAAIILIVPIWNWQIGRNFEYQIKSPILPLFLAILLAGALLFSKGIANSLLNVF